MILAQSVTNPRFFKLKKKLVIVLKAFRIKPEQLINQCIRHVPCIVPQFFQFHTRYQPEWKHFQVQPEYIFSHV